MMAWGAMVSERGLAAPQIKPLCCRDRTQPETDTDGCLCQKIRPQKVCTAHMPPFKPIYPELLKWNERFLSDSVRNAGMRSFRSGLKAASPGVWQTGLFNDDFCQKLLAELKAISKTSDLWDGKAVGAGLHLSEFGYGPFWKGLAGWLTQSFLSPFSTSASFSCEAVYAVHLSEGDWQPSHRAHVDGFDLVLQLTLLNASDGICCFAKDPLTTQTLFNRFALLGIIPHSRTPNLYSEVPTAAAGTTLLYSGNHMHTVTPISKGQRWDVYAYFKIIHSKPDLSSLLRMPNSVLRHIIAMLPPYDVTRLAQTCKFMRVMADTEYIWQHTSKHFAFPAEIHHPEATQYVRQVHGKPTKAGFMYAHQSWCASALVAVQRACHAENLPDRRLQTTIQRAQWEYQQHVKYAVRCLRHPLIQHWPWIAPPPVAPSPLLFPKCNSRTTEEAIVKWAKFYGKELISATFSLTTPLTYSDTLTAGGRLRYNSGARMPPMDRVLYPPVIPKSSATTTSLQLAMAQEKAAAVADEEVDEVEHVFLTLTVKRSELQRKSKGPTVKATRTVTDSVSVPMSR
eukprot:TRINITY_DN1239_c0_g1_i2.p1 TRINITY_DN1239_c0_g1~~TRINITY_DN1239_c0_g1_i2.p1  ORF type:complete len:567 (+),score=56.39 TRINITY_DN1239_c0_g1_i2:1020-2720(+)